MKSIRTSYKHCPVDIEYKEYCKIVYGFMKFIVNKLLHGEKIVLPVNMGTMEIVGTKAKISKNEQGQLKGLAPDWKATKKLWETDPVAKQNKRILYHFNDHTAGIRYRLYWTKTGANVMNKTMYTFIAVRNFKRSIWKNIMEHNVEYRIISRI